MLKKRNRIANKRLIAKLFKHGHFYKNRSFVFRFFPAQSSESQFTIVISRKMLKRAVDRNHLKRQISATLGQYLPSITKDTVALVLPRAYNQSVTFKQLDQGIRDFITHLSSKSHHKPLRKQ